MDDYPNEALSERGICINDFLFQQVRNWTDSKKNKYWNFVFDFCDVDIRFTLFKVYSMGIVKKTRRDYTVP